MNIDAWNNGRLQQTVLFQRSSEFATSSHNEVCSCTRRSSGGGSQTGKCPSLCCSPLHLRVARHCTSFESIAQHFKELYISKNCTCQSIVQHFKAATTAQIRNPTQPDALNCSISMGPFWQYQNDKKTHKTRLYLLCQIKQVSRCSKTK